MILDALKYIIQADTSQAATGIAKTRKSTDDLTEAMKKTEATAKKTTDSMVGFAKSILGFLGVALSAGAALNGAMKRAENVTGMLRLAEAIGVSVSEVDALGGAFDRAGVGAAKSQDLMIKLTEAIGRGITDVGSTEAKVFAGLGISLKDAQGKALGADQAILKIAGAVDGLGEATARVKLKDLGITDPATVELLIRGRQELERLVRVQKEQGVVSKESAENARKFTNVLNGLRSSSGQMFDSVLDKLIPTLTKIIEWLSKVIDYAGEHKDAIVGFFIAIGAAVAYFYLPSMIAAAAATLAATWPILAIGAAIGLAAAAFALIYDDIMNFIEGNNSMIGEIFKKYPMVEKIVMGLIQVFKDYFKIVSWVFENAGKIIGSFADDAVKTLDAMGKSIKAIFDWLVGALTGSFKFIGDGLDKIKTGAKAAASFLGFGDGEDKAPDAPYGSAVPTAPPTAAQGVQAANTQLNAAAGAPVNQLNSNIINSGGNKGNTETNVAVGQITVTTQATDAPGVAGSLRNELSDQLKNLETENASGVAR